MLAALGMFVFDIDSLLFEEMTRRRSWRHGRTDRFGARAAGQYLGPGEDAITLSGTLVPELAGRHSAIETLAEMAATGDAFPLADGSGTVHGNFTIENLEERKTNLLDNGQARTTGFTIELLRVD